ncbi:MAG: hypothetical protein K9G67_11035 [Bacteroidales bacterium]|nr:hypothetical protein [Bacteroidales bacterium]MCF8343213.1 hypothetical protein [Bacteroidales bacterium]MCF8351332.1 hypothetical protein [Bacteroidales bacterium]MCF8376880.1 hypothetical protein [Bacteroidales bacterium]MCF8401515.1 hypothetical protein [Bacteroidales bacterium]
MTKKELIKDAAKLRQPSEEAARTFSAHSHELLSELNRWLEQRDDLKKMIGKENLAMMRDNHANQVRFMESVFKAFDPQVFVETLLWVFRAYRSHGFQLAYWPAVLNALHEIIKEKLPDQLQDEILPFYTWIQLHIPQLANLSEPV